MKKIFTLFTLLFVFAISCYSKEEDMFLYKTTKINTNTRQIQKSNVDTIYLPETKKFNPLEAKNDNSKTKFSTTNGTSAYVAQVTTPVQPKQQIPVNDPYVIPINGNYYVLVIDKPSKNWTHNDLFGIYDSKNNRFKSLISLDTNHDLKITPQEIQKANIRMVQMDKQGTLLVNHKQKDYNLNNILYIDLKDLKRNANCEETGIFGHFNVYFKTSDYKTKIAVGYVTYDYEDDLKFMFK